MNISTKIATGFGALILLIVLMLACQRNTIDQAQSATERLGGTNFRAALLSLQLLRDLDQVEEFTRKLFATAGDPDYAMQTAEMRDSFSRVLLDLNALSLSPTEADEVAALQRLWSDFLVHSGEVDDASNLRDFFSSNALLREQLRMLSEVRSQAQMVIRASRETIAEQVAESSSAAAQAEKTALFTTLLALLVSVVVSLWIVRSISKPLKRLTEATRAVTRGELSYQLDLEGSDELSQLARDFDTMTRRLGELDQMKKDFVSHASHELKTPLASMQETNRLLLDRIPGPLTDQQQQLLQLTQESGLRLSRLIGNLLDLSRIEAGVMEYSFQPHDVRRLLEVCLREFEIPLREKRLTIHREIAEDPLLAHCDEDRMIQVFDNLLGNAMKFSPAGGTLALALQRESELPPAMPAMLRLRMASRASQAGYLLFSLTDSGPGIPAEDRLRIFEKFHQVRQGKKLAGQGTGLGLAITRTIVEAHHGTVWMEPNPEGGSIFRVLLPSQNSPEASRASAQPATLPARN